MITIADLDGVARSARRLPVRIGPDPGRVEAEIGVVPRHELTEQSVPADRAVVRMN